MADIVITAANVIAGANSQQERGQAGKDATTSEYMLADSNSATALARTPLGVALNGASDGQPLTIHKGGDLTIGATLTPGVAYYQSDTPGGICPVADVGSGEYSCIIGIAESASVLSVNIQASGVAL